MYQTFDATAVEGLLGIGPADRPQGLILHGTYNMPQKAREWRDRLGNARVAAKAFNVVIGEHAGQTIWYVPALGASMAAFALHCAAILDVKRIIQIGSFGGTRRGLDVGDLLVVTGAGRGDGASDWYMPDDTPPDALATPDEGLTQAVRALLEAHDLPWHEGPVYTTPAFMAETWEDILRWEEEGYAGVEMEAATTLAIAKHFGVPSACLIYLLDNLIEERHILHNTAEERALITERQLLVQGLALELVSRP
jgi:uridine phosphorylase